MAGKTDTEDDVQEKDIADLLVQITPFVEVLAPKIIEYQKVREPGIKRAQIINFVIMMTIVMAVFVLAWYKIIDGSGVTGLIGAIIGYVFGGLYQQKSR